MRLCERVPKFDVRIADISNLINKAKIASRQLNGWIESLKNSEIKGIRYLTDKERRNIQQDKEFAEFDAEMARFKQESEKR